MGTATARIPVRSERQALEWSLVLISQGIQAEIDHTQDAGWGLLVARSECQRALRSLRQYRIENRGWPWQQPILRPGLLFDWGCLAWALLAGVFFWLNTRWDLQAAGLMDSAAVAHGQWWRLFTAVWLHADLAHLATNLAIGLLLLGLAMGHYGTGVGLLAAYLCGVGGNLLTCLVAAQPHRGLGASGMVMGGLGLLVAQSLGLWRQSPSVRKLILSGACGGVMLFVLLALSPEADVLAHLGGFLGGLVLGTLLSLGRGIALRPAANVSSGLLFALLVVVPWWLALDHTGG